MSKKRSRARAQEEAAVEVLKKLYLKAKLAHPQHSEAELLEDVLHLLDARIRDAMRGVKGNLNG